MRAPKTSPELGAPLSPADFEKLVQALGQHASFDSDGLLGILHAVATAPSLIAPSEWLSLVFEKDAFAEVGRERTTEVFGLLMRQYSEVVATLASGAVLTPPPDDVDGCALFAEGFVLAAECDDAWRSDEEAWSLVVPLAYLADLREFVPETELAKLDADPESEKKICESFDEVVGKAYRVLQESRIESTPQTS